MLKILYMQNIVQPKSKVTKELLTVKANVVICIVLSLKSDRSKNGITTQRSKFNESRNVSSYSDNYISRLILCRQYTTYYYAKCWKQPSKPKT